MALHLPLKSLFRCRAVCNLWRDVIDSPSFRKLHTLTNYNDEKVYLQVNYDDFLGDAADVKVSIKLLGLFKSSNLNLVELKEGFPSRRRLVQEKLSKLSARAKGLICFNLSIWESAQPLAICNPFLGQSKILPFSPVYASPNCKARYRDVGIGRDEEGELYKVVELVYCDKHSRLHAHLYSAINASWREVGGLLDQQMTILDAIALAGDDGRFAHWYTSTRVILTFDMDNEVFSTTKMPDSAPSDGHGYGYRIVAKDDGRSFILIVFPSIFRSSDNLVRIYETEEEEEEEEGIRKLSWNNVVNFQHSIALRPTPTPLPLPRRDCVIVDILDAKSNWERKMLLYDCRARRFILDAKSNWERKMLLYDYRARRFIGCFSMPDPLRMFDIFYYRGTFVSP